MLEDTIRDLTVAIRALVTEVAALRVEKPHVVAADSAQMPLPLEQPTEEQTKPSAADTVLKLPTEIPEQTIEDQPSPAEVSPPAAPAPEVTFAQVRDAMLKMIKDRGPIEMARLLTKFGCGSVQPNANNLKPDQYGAFIDAIRVATEN